MVSATKIFLARAYLITDDYGGVRIDDEALFSSLGDANDYLSSLRRDDVDTDSSSYILFRTEIVEYELGNIDTYVQKWIYSVRGELLEHKTHFQTINDTRILTNVEIFCIGDVVRIVPRIYNQSSPSAEGTFGVVVESPGNLNTNNNATENYPKEHYTVYFINETGLLDHLHAKESVMSLAKEVPDELKFLVVLSRHLKQEQMLPENMIARLFEENIFVKNVQMFDLNKSAIRDMCC